MSEADKNKDKQYRNAMMTAPDSLFEKVGVKKDKIIADLIYLQKKHPEYFKTYDDVKKHIEWVLDSPDFLIPASNPNYTLLLRMSDKDRLAVVEFHVKKSGYEVKSAYVPRKGQVDKIKKASGKVVNSSSAGDSIENNFNPPSGLTGVPSDTHSADQLNILNKNLDVKRSTVKKNDIIKQISVLAKTLYKPGKMKWTDAIKLASEQLKKESPEAILSKTKNPVIGNKLIKYALVMKPFEEKNLISLEEDERFLQKAAYDGIREGFMRIEKWTYQENDKGEHKLIKREPTTPEQGPSKRKNPLSPLAAVRMARKVGNPADRDSYLFAYMKRWEKDGRDYYEALKTRFGMTKAEAKIAIRKYMESKKISNPAQTVSVPYEDGLALLAKATVIKIGRENKTLSGHDLFATADGRWLLVIPGSQKKRTNANVSGDAKELFEQFRQYEIDHTGKVNIPFEKGMKLIGEINAIEYDSDKMIYKTDKRSGSARMRTYVHKFDDPPKIFKLNAMNAWIIGRMSKPVTHRGIEA